MSLEVLWESLKNFSSWINVTMIMSVLILNVLMLNPFVIDWNSILFDMNTIYLSMITLDMNMLFLKTVSVISLSIFLWSLSYMSSYKSTMFYLSLLMFVLSMLLLSLSEGLMMLFLGWEGLGITSFILIIFYQNWMSAKGGLLTLLTNRLGDAIFMISFCGFFLIKMGELEVDSSVFLITLLLTLTLTKSAQWPFISWLPAAMAAPTPVSSLVHSSTLVTAGIWLMIRFSYMMTISTIIWSMLGVLTLMVASLSALMETDAKKMVALSTLSQLGLMFISLAVGNPLICFFHVIMHAFAKANLFMVIGSLLHSSFSQQDSRLIFSNTMSTFLTISMSVSLVSLIGLTFMSGFFSKEQILMSHLFLMNSYVSFILLISIAGLTMSYCLKLFFSVLHLNNESVFKHSFISMSQLTPILFLSSMSIISGFMMSMNMNPCSLLLSSVEMFYWSVMSLGLICISISYFMLTIMYFGFLSQSKAIDSGISYLTNMKILTSGMESSSSEIMYLSGSLFFLKSMKYSVRFMILFSLMSIMNLFI